MYELIITSFFAIYQRKCHIIFDILFYAFQGLDCSILKVCFSNIVIRHPQCMPCCWYIHLHRSYVCLYGIGCTQETLYMASTLCEEPEEIFGSMLLKKEQVLCLNRSSNGNKVNIFGQKIKGLYHMLIGRLQSNTRLFLCSNITDKYGGQTYIKIILGNIGATQT